MCSLCGREGVRQRRGASSASGAPTPSEGERSRLLRDYDDETTAAADGGGGGGGERHYLLSEGVPLAQH